MIHGTRVCLVRGGASSLVAPPVPLPLIAAVSESRFGRFKNPADVVAQVVALSRVTSVEVSGELWSDVAATVTHSLGRFTGQDLATIMKKFKGPRDEVMLAGICAALKYLPSLRLVRPGDIADILSGFHRFNFVPSVEVLNVLGAEGKLVLENYSLKNGDLCKFLRYFAIMERNPSLCVDFEKQWIHPDLVPLLRDKVAERIGYMTPSQMGIIVPYAPGISLESFMVNFARAENTPKKVEEFFFRQLDKRFGENTWRECYYLLRPGMVNSTGWGNSVAEDEWSDEEDGGEIELKKRERTKYPLLRLDERDVEEVLQRLPRLERAESPRSKDDILEKSADFFSSATPISSDQLALLAAFESEMGMVRRPQPPPVEPFADRPDKRMLRKRERWDSRGQGVPESTRARVAFKAKRKRKLFRFAVLSHLVRSCGS